VSYLELVESELENFEIELPEEQRVTLGQYCEELQRWNEKLNLTALSGVRLVRRLVVEPVWIARQLSFTGCLMDIGSGNGSPAIPFQIVSAFEASHLIESRVRRAAFLRHVSAKLRLQHLEIHRGRFEALAASLGRADWISMQAVAFSERLLEFIRLIASTTTTIVWITSSTATPFIEPISTLRVPITGTQVFLFQLDLS